MHRLLALVLIAGCSPTTFVFTPTTSRGVVAKPSGCAFEVLTAPPSKDFQEIGTLEHYNGDVPGSLQAFQRAVAQRVCEVGGDAIIAIPDAKNHYTSGTVIEYPKRFTP